MEHLKDYNKYIQIGKICYYIFWIILLIGKGLGYSSTYSGFKNMVWIAVVFALIKMLFTSWDTRDKVICVALNTLGICVWYFSGDAAVLLTIISITSIVGINIYKLFKISFWIKAIFFFVRTSLAIFGVIDSQKIYRYISEVNEGARYGLGYGHPNSTHYTLFIIVALGIIVYRDKLKFTHYILISVYNYLVFIYTDSKTGFILTMLLIMGSYLFGSKKIELLQKVIDVIGDKAYIIATLISFMICLLIDKLSYLRELGTLTARFMTAVDTIKNFSITLFGNTNVITDFGYINILYGNGIIVFLLFIIMNTLTMRTLKKNNLYIELWVFVCYAIYTLSEAYTISILMNPLMVLFSVIIFPHIKYTNGIISYSDN